MAIQGTKDYEVLKGATWAGSVVTVNVNAAALDLTGASVVMEIRSAVSNQIALTLSTTGGEITLTDAANGEFTIGSQTITLPEGEYRYATTITLSGGDIKRYIKGDFIVRREFVENE